MKRVILAPHVDDEVIGCWSVFAGELPADKMDVVYFHEVDLVRRGEAKKAAAALGFTPHFNLFDESVETLLHAADEVYVPSRWDHHTHHRMVNQKYRGYATHFYSVDMVDAQPLPALEQASKRRTLSDCYPSQSDLWTNDAKYWLFESIHKADFEVYRTLEFNAVTVTVLAEYADDVEKWISLYYNRSNPTQSFSDVLRIAGRGEVTMKVGNLTFKARQTS